MSNIAQDQGLAVTGGARSRRLLPLVLALVAVTAGCSQTTPQTVTEATLTAPLVLNSAPAASGGTTVAPIATAPAAVTATAAAPPPAAAQSAAAPVAATPPPTALQTEPMPTTAAAATEAEGQFPNINKAPGQPGGTLLAEDARAQIISQLEALREKQSATGGAGNGGGKPSDLANQASTHGQAAIDQIEACSQEGALENNPACAPAD